MCIYNQLWRFDIHIIQNKLGGFNVHIDARSVRSTPLALLHGASHVFQSLYQLHQHRLLFLDVNFLLLPPLEFSHLFQQLIRFPLQKFNLRRQFFIQRFLPQSLRRLLLLVCLQLEQDAGDFCVGFLHKMFTFDVLTTKFFGEVIILTLLLIMSHLLHMLKQFFQFTGPRTTFRLRSLTSYLRFV